MKKVSSITIFFFVALSSIVSVYAKVNCKEGCFNTGDSSTEKKVDYLERIYFSGENKDGLNAYILIALQELEGKTPTPALARQVTFLLEIKDKAVAANNSCDVLDLLAVGIYNIDASEAQFQGVKAPSNKAKEKTVDAVASLNKLNSATQGISSTASSLAWSSYLLSGKTGGFGTAGKVAGAASTFGAVAGTATQLGQLGKDLGLFKKKDKPCSEVAKKAIEIGLHQPPVVNAVAGVKPKSTGVSNDNTMKTEINITSISSAALRVLADSLSNRPNIRESEKSFSQASSKITVIHTGNTDSIVDWITDNFSSKFTVKNYSKGKISLVAKK